MAASGTSSSCATAIAASALAVFCGHLFPVFHGFAGGKGVATALVHAVYAEAEKAGASRVYWLTHETNATAIRLYEEIAERSGFIQFRKIMPR